MSLAEVLNTTGLALDIVGFALLFALAWPAAMSRNFVASERVGVDGVEMDYSATARYLDPVGAKERDQRRQRRLTLLYVTGGALVLGGFLLQFVASIVS